MQHTIEQDYTFSIRYLLLTIALSLTRPLDKLLMFGNLGEIVSAKPCITKIKKKIT